MAKMHTYTLWWLDKGRFVSGRVPNVLSSQLVTLSNWQILHILQMELNQVASVLLWTIGFCVNSWMPLGITPLLNHSLVSRISYHHLLSESHHLIFSYPSYLLIIIPLLATLSLGPFIFHWISPLAHRASASIISESFTLFYHFAFIIAIHLLFIVVLIHFLSIV